MANLGEPSASARAASSTSFVTVTVDRAPATSSSTPRRVATATVTIDSFGVPMHGPSSDDEKQGESSQTPVGHCGQVSSDEAVSKTQNVCPGPDAVNTKTTAKAPSSAVNGCPQGTQGAEPVSIPGYGSPINGSAFTTAVPSTPLSAAQLSTGPPSLSISRTNTTSGPGVLSTGTAPGSGVLPSPVLSQTGASGSAPGSNLSVSFIPSQTGASGSEGPIYVNATGTSDASWQEPTSVSDSWDYTQEGSAPSDVADSDVFGTSWSFPQSLASTSGGTGRPTGSAPIEGNASQTVSAPSSIVTSGSIPPGTTGSPMEPLPGSVNSSQVVSTPSGIIPSGVSPSGFIPSGATPSEFIPSGATPSGLISSATIPSAVASSPTESFDWDYSQTVGAPSDVTGVSTGSLSGARNPSQTSVPYNPIPSGFIPSDTTVNPTGPLSGGGNASQIVTTPSNITPSGSTIAPVETTVGVSSERPPREGNNSSSSEGASAVSDPTSIPSPLTPGSDIISDREEAEPSSSGFGGTPSFPYDPPNQILRRAASAFVQQGVVQDLVALFTFPESTDGLYKRQLQSDQGPPTPDGCPPPSPGMYRGSHSFALRLTRWLQPKTKQRQPRQSCQAQGRRRRRQLKPRRRSLHAPVNRPRQLLKMPPLHRQRVSPPQGMF